MIVRAHLLQLIGCLSALLLPAGCASMPRAPDLGGLYNQAARYHGEERNPVIVIPGILGSRLVDEASGRIVWGAFGGGAADAGSPEGRRMAALPMRPGAPLADLRDQVQSAGALESFRFSILGLPVELSAYRNILMMLGAGGYLDEAFRRSQSVDFGADHFTCFQFDYDWRRSNVENARKLHDFILAKGEYVRRERARRYGTDAGEVRFDIVAHSMGGLLARYYVMYGSAPLPEDGSLPGLTWAGARYVRRLIMVGTPNAGSVRALDQLRHGLHIPTQARYAAAVLGTMPSVYELLPRARHGAVVDAGNASGKLEPLDPVLWEEQEWGLIDPRQGNVLRDLLPDVADPADRRAIAMDHLRKCLMAAQRLQAALDRPAVPPEGLELDLVAGDAEKTPAVVRLDRRASRIAGISYAPGDGTVTRQSALADERMGSDWRPYVDSPIEFSHVQFLFTSHLGMTRDPAFSDNILYRLLEAPDDRN
jgi:hypothetical protein